MKKAEYSASLYISGISIPATACDHPGVQMASTVMYHYNVNKAAIKAWAQSAVPGQTKSFVLDAGRRVVGEGVVRSTGQLQTMTKMTLVVRKVQDQNRIYFVLTAYPKP